MVAFVGCWVSGSSACGGCGLSSVQAVPGQIRAAGLAARGLAEQVGAVNLVGAADAVSGWMPGGDAATAADELAEVWKQRVADLDGDLDSHGANLQVCAAAFDAQEDYNADAVARAAQ